MFFLFASIACFCHSDGLLAIAASKDWGSATAIVRAFQIGKAEAAAVSNLQSGVEKEVVVILKKEVSIRGLRSYLGHEIVAKGLFNTGYSSSSGATEQWVSVCTNLDDCKLVACQRTLVLCNLWLPKTDRSFVRSRSQEAKNVLDTCRAATRKVHIISDTTLFQGWGSLERQSL